MNNIELTAPTIQLPLIPMEPVIKVKRTGTVRQHWQTFHRANPHIYRALRIMAIDAKERGKNYSIELLINVLRYVYEVGPDGPGLAINNNFKAYYARHLNQDPELVGYFPTRQRRGQQNEN